MSTENHPARVAGEKSRDAVARGDRQAWLALWAEDACIEDPVGVSPLDPTGRGHRGPEAIARFWDEVIKRDPKTRTSFDYHTQYCAGDECACVGSLTNHFPDGSSFQVFGVFVYRVNGEGKLVSLRTYWEFEQGVFRKAGE
ncbi:MAG: nuclear transport factor 2 family protein [Myxococcota bacterium]